jgi:hypothetical protein
MGILGKSRKPASGNTPTPALGRQMAEIVAGTHAVAAATRQLEYRINQVPARLARLETRLAAARQRLDYLEAVQLNEPTRVTYHDDQGQPVADPLGGWDGLSSIRITN